MSSVPNFTSAPADTSAMRYLRMQATDLGDVEAVENAAYPFPWTHGNFLDSLASGYEAWVLREADGALAGYFLVMAAVDEAHLLNITVRPGLQGRGLGWALLDKVVEVARGKGMASVLLEVRPSNQRALSVYRRYGFLEIGRRRGYYPAAGNTREDAIVMRFSL